MERYNLVVPKVPLNTNQPTSRGSPIITTLKCSVLPGKTNGTENLCH